MLSSARQLTWPDLLTETIIFRSTRLTHWLLSCLPVLQNLVMDKLFARNIGNKEKPHVKKIIFTHKNTAALCGMRHYLATRVAENLDLRESSTSYKVDILQTTFLEVPELLRDVLLLLRQWAGEKRSWWELDPLEFHEKVDDDHRVANLPIVLDQWLPFQFLFEFRIVWWSKGSNMHVHSSITRYCRNKSYVNLSSQTLCGNSLPVSWGPVSRPDDMICVTW